MGERDQAVIHDGESDSVAHSDRPSDKQKHDAEPHAGDDFESLPFDEQQKRALLPEKEMKWLLFRQDVLLMPLLTFGYGMQYYDKAILATATLFGILKDLNMTTERYKTASACFYYGFLAGALPMAFLVQRCKGQLHLFLGGAVIAWGAVVMLTCVVADYRGLYAQRFCLGFVESTVPPGFVAVTRMWYTKRAQPLRLGIWWSAVGLFAIVSGVINHRLGQLDTSLASWKLIFLVPGSVTIAFGFILLLVLPPTPLRPAILSIKGYNRFSDAQRNAIDVSVRANLTGNERAGSPWNWQQAKLAMRDPQIYILFLMATATYVSNGAFTVFGPIFVKTIGYTSLRATILLSPGGATAAVGIYVFTYLATNRRVVRTPFARTTLHVVSCWPTIIGCVMCWRGDWANKAVPLAGFYLLPIFGAAFVMTMASSTANMAGSTKQAIASSAIFLGYNCGNIASSYVLVASEAREHYPTTFQITIGCMCATMGLAILSGVMYSLDNRSRDRKYGKSAPFADPSNPLRGAEAANGGMSASQKEQYDKEVDEMAKADLTDRENMHFRYIY